MKRIQTGDKIEILKLRVSPEFKNRVRKQAKARGVSLSDIVRHGIELIEKEGAAAVGKRKKTKRVHAKLEQASSG